MERFDCYTPDGFRTGRTAVKGTPCKGNDYYLGVHIYLYDSNGRFLLQKRAEDKEFLPGGWEIHMGHVIAGESGLEAARREISEELGVLFPPDRFLHIARFVWNEYHHLIDIFFLKADLEPGSLHLQKEEVSGVKWVSKEEMLSFIRGMEYRPAGYREAVLHYMEHAF